MSAHATIVGIEVRSVVVPFRLTPRSASGVLSDASLALIDVHTSVGITGHSYLFAISPMMLSPLANVVKALAGMIEGKALAPLDLEAELRRSLTLLDTPGLVGLAIAGLDMACWDAHAKVMGQPLASVLGSARTTVPAYNSCGLWIQEPAALADEALLLIDEGDFSAIKLRLGRPDPEEDIQAIEIVRARIDDSIALMVDYNQSQTPVSAKNRLASIDDLGLYWIEEPIRHGNFSACADLTALCDTPIQIGENIQSNYELKQAIESIAADYYMPDVQRIGGVTGWLRAAAQCHAAEIPMSSHLFPEFSAQLLAATPTCHWLEYVDWASPILLEPIKVIGGHVRLSSEPGVGINWDEDAIARYQV